MVSFCTIVNGKKSHYASVGKPSGLSIDQYDAPTKEVGQFQRQPTTFNRLDLVFAPISLLCGNVPLFTILSIHEYIFSPFLPFVSFVLV